jgi:hypothetical protein
VAHFELLGITDLHLSHAEKGLDPAREGWSFRVHSWPLIAPNIEVPSRRDGIAVGKPIGERRYFASFIGAHMPHYRSEVRLRLLEAARASGRADVVIDLGSEWHFNKVVYKEQVQGKELSDSEADVERLATRRYNEVLSDSIFSLCPEGAGPNTLRLWESLAVGSIPVIISDTWRPPAEAGGGSLLEEAAIWVQSERAGEIFSLLQQVSAAELQARQRAALGAYERYRRRRAFGSRPEPAGG